MDEVSGHDRDCRDYSSYPLIAFGSSQNSKASCSCNSWENHFLYGLLISFYFIFELLVIKELLLQLFGFFMGQNQCLVLLLSLKGLFHFDWSNWRSLFHPRNWLFHPGLDFYLSRADIIYRSRLNISNGGDVCWNLVYIWWIFLFLRVVRSENIVLNRLGQD